MTKPMTRLAMATIYIETSITSPDVILVSEGSYKRKPYADE